MRLRRREAPSPLAALMSTGRDELDAGALVRALARSVVHVPLPGAGREPLPRVVSSTDGEGPPLYVVEDDDGRHAFLFSTPRRLVAALGDGAGAASVPFSTLALGWPVDVDLVVDPGHPDALEVPLPVLRHALLEVAGIPTGTSLQPSPGDLTRRPEPEPAQLLGAAREAAAALPEVRALWRAETVPDVPAPRPVLDLHVDLDPVPDDRQREVLAALGRAVSAVEPRPVRVTASVEGRPRGQARLAAAVQSVDEPFYRRS